MPTASGNCATSLHDPVCGLPNRIYFSERLERAIAEVRNGGPTAAVFYIDLDHFSDEFAIIMICAADNYSLQAVAERILAANCTPFVVSGHSINIGASIGIAVIDSRTRNAFLRYADMALYRAKNEGRNRACIYDAAMDADLSNRKLLEGALRQDAAAQRRRRVFCAR